MALALKFTVIQSDDCKTITVTETTGVYNSTSNIGGWGTPNPAFGSALTATILFKKRNSDGTFTTYNLVNVFPTLPSNSNGTVNITGSQIGLGTDSTIADGIWELTYTVTGVDGASYTAIATLPIYITCAIEGCWKKLAASVSACPCNCDPLEDRLNDLFIKFELLQAAINKGDFTVIQDYIDSLTKLCGDDCGCN